MGLTGIEPDDITDRDDNDLREIEKQGGAKSGALADENGSFDPRLQMIIDAWPALPESVREGILGLVKAVEA